MTADAASVATADWCAAMRRQRLSTGTIRKRRGELASWSDHIGAGWRTATWRDVDRWIDSRPLGPRAQASAVSHLRSFYKWARREGLVSCDPCADVICPRLPVCVPRPARDVDVRRAVGAGLEPLELACALMAYAALRCCEVARLQWADVDLADGLIYVTGKGDKQAVVPICPPLAAILAVQVATDGPVVPGSRGQTCTAARISQRVGAHLRKRGAAATAHQLRHHAATHLLAITGRIDLVKEFLRHASISTTQVYARTAPGALAAALADW